MQKVPNFRFIQLEIWNFFFGSKFDQNTSILLLLASSNPFSNAE